jgi:hypothetical protein
VNAYSLELGTSGAGSNDLFASGQTTVTSVNVSGLPTQGGTVYATLHSLIGGVWQSKNYTFSAYGSAPPRIPRKPHRILPVRGRGVSEAHLPSPKVDDKRTLDRSVTAPHSN